MICQCGCGTKIPNVSSRGVPRKYKLGHNNKGKHAGFLDLSGRVFGEWTVIKLHSRPSADMHHCVWVCLCSCGRMKKVTSSNLKRGKGRGCSKCANGNRLRPFEALYNTLVKQAKGRAVVHLSYEDYLSFTAQKSCHYCDVHLVWEPFNKMNGHKLDRKNNSLGYSRSNCVVCCSRCNRAKSNHFTYEEWVQIGAVIKSWRT